MSYWAIGYKKGEILVDGDRPFEFMKDAIIHIYEQYEEDWGRKPEPEELLALFTRALPLKKLDDFIRKLQNLYPDVG